MRSRLYLIIQLGFLLAIPAHAEQKEAGLVITCDPQFLPSKNQTQTYETTSSSVGGILIKSIDEVGTKVIIEDNKPTSHGNVSSKKSSPDREMAIVTKPKYVSTIWNPSKTKVWCAVYSGEVASKMRCNKINNEYFVCPKD